MSEIWDDENLDLEEEVERAEESFLQSELVRRISKAKLFESLLTASFFDEEDVEESIKKEVEKEIKSFIVLKLEELLGLKQADKPKAVPQSIQNTKTKSNKTVFGLTEEEMIALKMVAKKVTGAQTQDKKIINKKRKLSETAKEPQTRAAGKTKTESELEKSSNVSRTTGQNYAQVNNPEKIPQPSQEAINQLMQAQASRAFSNFSSGNTPESQIMAAAIGLAQQKNKNVKED
jgi:hypothetical protein